MINGKQLLDSSVADGKLTTSYLKTDGTRVLTGIQAYDSAKNFVSDLQIPDKKYVDDAVAGAVASEMTWKGGYNAATNTPDLDTAPVAGTIKKGDAYRVTVAGNFFTEAMEVGDSIIADIDDAAALADFTRLQANRGVDDSTIEVFGNNYQLKDDGVTGAKLAPAVAGAGLAQDGSGNLDVVATDTSIVVAASAIRAAVPSALNKNMTASVTAADGAQATATTVAAAPAAGSYPKVEVNGVGVLVGDGTKVAVEAYFSGDAGANARAFSAIVATDTLHWNGSVAGYQLAASDRIDLFYNV